MTAKISFYDARLPSPGNRPAAPLYPVNEMFETLQGEAAFTGTPSVFIRLQGCPVGCAWCDTKHTWDLGPDNEGAAVDVVNKSGESSRFGLLSPRGIVDLASTFKARHAVITGGEPALYNLHPLCEALHEAGFETQVETSGTFPLLLPADTWVTVSPKIGMAGGRYVQPSALIRADEIKHPVAIERNITELEDLLTQVFAMPDHPDADVWLQPVWQAKRSRQLCIDAAIARNWRVSFQVHKLVDLP